MGRLTRIPRDTTGRLVKRGGLITSPNRGIPGLQPPYQGAGIYVNPELAGGAPSGPVDGNNPPTGHGIGFNTIDSRPDGDGAWLVNESGADGRSFLTYDVAANHPGLLTGDIIEFSWLIEYRRGGNTAVLGVAGTAGVDSSFPDGLLSGTVANSRRRRVILEVLDAVAFAATVRVGAGATNGTTATIRISKPSARLLA